MTARRPIITGIFLLGVIAFVMASTPALHHFDDFAYLYGARHFSMHELLHGGFEASNVPGFYNPKAGHLVMLKGMIALLGDGLPGLHGIEIAYTLLVIGSGLLYALTLNSLLRFPSTTAALAGAMMLTVPVTIYFAGKLLAEGPAMFWAAASSLLFALATRRTGAMQTLLCVLAGACLAFSVYTRIQFVLCPAAMLAALLILPPGELRRRAMLRPVLLAGIAATLIVIAIDVLGDAQLMRSLGTADVIASQHTALRERAGKIVDAFGPYLAALPVALLLIRRSEVRFLLTWFLFATLPFLVLFDFLETRWMLVGAPALAALAAIGFVACLERLSRLGGAGARVTQVATALLAVVLITWYGHRLQARTEYGLDEAALNRNKAWIDSTYPGRPILVPWAHSDYHYLSFAYPRDPIYVVTTKTFFTPQTYIKDPALWPDAMRGWYRDRFVADFASLRRTGDGPWLAIAWQNSPGGWNGFEQSWISGDANLRPRIVHRDGPYQVYLLENAADRAPGP